LRIEQNWVGGSVRPGPGLRMPYFLGILKRSIPYIVVFYPATNRQAPISQLIAGLFWEKMFTNQAGFFQKQNIERMRMRSELYKLLESGFGQYIANKMSSNIVNTLESARATLSKFQQ